MARRGIKKVLLYGGLLAAGAALGMQLVSGGDASGGYTAQAGALGGSANGTTGSVSLTPAGSQNTAVNRSGGAVTGAGAGSYEQGTYVKLPDGTTYYYVQKPGSAQSSYPAPSSLPQVTAGSGGSAGGTGDSGLSPYQSPGQLLLSPSPQTSVDRFADKTGELLQNVSQKSINWVVSLFGSLTD